MICSSPSTIVMKNFGNIVFRLCHGISHLFVIFAASID